jgi:hypothetical protein
MRLKDILTVMTSAPVHTLAVTDITLTCTDDLTRLTNAHKYNTLKPIWQAFCRPEILIYAVLQTS